MEVNNVSDVDSVVQEAFAALDYEYQWLMRSAGWLYWEHKYNLSNLKAEGVDEIECDFYFDPFNDDSSWYSPADDEFRATFVDPLWETRDLDPYKMENDVRVAESVRFEDDLRLTCAWAISSRQLFDQNILSESLTHLCRAYDHLGQARLRARVPTLFGNAISNRGRKGSTKRDEMYAPLRKLAREKAFAKPNGEPYPSKRNAALSIKDEVLAKARDLGIELSANQAERTITGWLDGMSFGSKQ
ncbi:hypothetical protein PQQ84_33145 [Paraburkholderia strydomiana]|uniref:hypothetical protein n=1 Tax=Paraburkholderia strydomiana TaxID=1245417 RepID=UPI0038BDE13B